jgi:hypothetical protein
VFTLNSESGVGGEAPRRRSYSANVLPHTFSQGMPSPSASRSPLAAHREVMVRLGATLHPRAVFLGAVVGARFKRSTGAGKATNGKGE